MYRFPSVNIILPDKLEYMLFVVGVPVITYPLDITDVVRHHVPHGRDCGRPGRGHAGINSALNQSCNTNQTGYSYIVSVQCFIYLILPNWHPWCFINRKNFKLFYWGERGVAAFDV